MATGTTTSLTRPPVADFGLTDYPATPGVQPDSATRSAELDTFSDFAHWLLPEANRALAAADPTTAIDWSIQLAAALAGLEQPLADSELDGRALPIVMSTSMGVNAAVMLHAVTAQLPGIPVVWVDTGFNVAEAYRVADQLERDLKLNLKVYSPRMTSERIRSLAGGIPLPEEADEHRRFTQLVKLEPFDRAIKELCPRVWLTGIRREETAHRRTLDKVTFDARGLIKVAPFFDATEQDLEDYRRRYSLPSTLRYFDPTKVHEGRECGLHTQSTAV